MQRTITQYKSLHDLPICLHRSCNDFHYARENSTEATYSTSNLNYETTIYITPKISSKWAKINQKP